MKTTYTPYTPNVKNSTPEAIRAANLHSVVYSTDLGTSTIYGPISMINDFPGATYNENYSGHVNNDMSNNDVDWLDSYDEVEGPLTYLYNEFVLDYQSTSPTKKLMSHMEMFYNKATAHRKADVQHQNYLLNGPWKADKKAYLNKNKAAKAVQNKTWNEKNKAAKAALNKAYYAAKKAAKAKVGA